MRFEAVLDLLEGEPIFESGLLLAGNVDPRDVRRQLSRWVAGGRVYRLRRGLYSVGPPFLRVPPHPFLIANRLVVGSYVSLQSALAQHGLIPEHVPVTTSVTTGRPGRWDTPLGAFEFHHVHRDLFTGYRLEEVAPGQKAFLAGPAKALIDLVHLVPGADATKYLEELRLTGLEGVEFTDLLRSPAVARRPKLGRAIRRLQALAAAEAEA